MKASDYLEYAAKVRGKFFEKFPIPASNGPRYLWEKTKRLCNNILEDGQFESYAEELNKSKTGS